MHKLYNLLRFVIKGFVQSVTNPPRHLFHGQIGLLKITFYTSICQPCTVQHKIFTCVETKLASFGTKWISWGA